MLNNQQEFVDELISMTKNNLIDWEYDSACDTYTMINDEIYLKIQKYPPFTINISLFPVYEIYFITGLITGKFLRGKFPKKLYIYLSNKYNNPNIYKTFINEIKN